MTVKQEESAVCPPDALEKRIQQAQLTKCQHRIADYFLKNRNRICRMTSLAIAQEVGVSDASVIRFSRAVGYTGFADLRESLYDAFRQELTSMDIGRYAPAQRLDLQINEFGGLNLSTDFLRQFSSGNWRQPPPWLPKSETDGRCGWRRKPFILTIDGGWLFCYPQVLNRIR